MSARRSAQSARDRRRRRPGAPWLIALSGVIAATLLVALGARSVTARNWCADHPVVVNVTASAEIEPFVLALGRYYNRQHHVISGHCAEVAVRAGAPGEVAAALAGQGAPTALTAAGQTPGPGSAPARPARRAPADVWIPDSSLWPALLAADPAARRRIRLSGPDIATSPLVIAMPRSAAARTPAYGTSVGWGFLLAPGAGGPPAGLGLHLQFPDPTASGTGLVALGELQRLLPSGAAARAAFARFLYHSQVVPAPGGQASLASLAVSASTVPALAETVTVVPEQEAIAFDRAHPDEPLAIRYPAGGSGELSFPYVLTTARRLTVTAAEQFGRLLRSPYARSYLRYEGFRVADAPLAGQWPAWYGLTTGEPALAAPVTPAAAGQSLRAWQRLSLGSRDLALIDVSAAMNAPSRPRGPALAQVLGRAAGLGLAQFPDSTQMGLWAFASHLDGALPYRQLVPLGPLPGPFGLVSRRQEIAAQAQSAHADPRTPADLYGALLAAYRRMLATYQPHYVNAVVVLTAGVDNAPGGISAAAAVEDLRKLYDPARPVEIVAIMAGRAGDFAALQQMAAVTGGQAADISGPAQIGKIFYQAMAQRICQPNCPG